MCKSKSVVYVNIACYLDGISDEIINNQISSCAKVAEYKYLYLDMAFVDIGYTSNNVFRPVFLRMLTYIYDNNISYLIVPSASALSADTENYLKVKEYLESIGTELIII